jgi:hypothetical protein
MNTFRKLVVGVGVAALAMAGVVGSAFAQNITPPVMDSGIQSGVLAIVTGMKDTIFANILAVLPVAGLVLVTLMGIGVLIGFFHRIARH